MVWLDDSVEFVAGGLRAGEGCAQRHTLGPDVAIEFHPFDETNTRIRPEKLARMIEDAGAGMVMLDLAMTPVTNDENLEMLHAPSAPAFIEQEHRRQPAKAEAREQAGCVG